MIEQGTLDWKNKVDMKENEEKSLAITPLLGDIREMIDNARQVVATVVNAELSLLYWNVGRRINKEILHEKRAEYGKQIIATLSNQLTTEYGKGWSEKLLRHCLRVVEVFQDKQIFSTLCRQFSWSHIRLFMYIDDPLKRNFYIEISRIEKWSVRILQERINSLLFERTAISRKPEETIAHDLKALREQGEISADLVFRDPYLLDFLGFSSLN
jgi:hypothetical protein